MGSVLAVIVILMLIAWPLALWLGYRAIKRKVIQVSEAVAGIFRRKKKDVD